MLKEKLWRFIADRVFKHPHGQVLPWYLIAIRFSIRPLQSVYWALSSKEGYQPARDAWKINGRYFSGALFWNLSIVTPENMAIRIIENENGVITVEKFETKTPAQKTSKD